MRGEQQVALLGRESAGGILIVAEHLERHHEQCSQDEDGAEQMVRVSQAGEPLFALVDRPQGIERDAHREEDEEERIREMIGGGDEAEPVLAF